MASKEKKSMPQKLMYPKTLVYPTQGEEFQLEMIRSRLPLYQQVSHDTSDMEMTVALDANITLNIPLMNSNVNGKNFPTKVPVDSDIDEELMKLCAEEEHSVYDKDLKLQRLSDNEVMFENSKENTVAIHCTKQGFGFTPSANDDNSLASWHGNSLMGTRLNFSEADSISMNRNSSLQRKPLEFISKDVHQPYSCMQDSFSVLEDPSLSMSNLAEQNGSQSMHKVPKSRVPLGIIEESSHSLLPHSFAAFEDPSLSSSSIVDCLEKKPNFSKAESDFSTRVPLAYVGNSKFDSQSTEVVGGLESTSRLFVCQNNTSQNEQLRNPSSSSAVKKTSGRNQSVKEANPKDNTCTSFSVYEEPSQIVTSPPDPKPPLGSTGYSKIDREHEIGFTEFDIPSCSTIEPTSTPTGRRTGFNMSVDLTAIHSDVISDLQNRAATCKLFADNDLQGQHQLETIHEESRSNYTGSTSSNSSKSTSRISMLSAATQPADDGVLLAGILTEPGVIKAFTKTTTDFMLQSIPISRTPVVEMSCTLQNLDKVDVGDSTYTVVKEIAAGSFSGVYLAQSPNKREKILKVAKPSCSWECAIIEELYKRLEANDLRSKVFSFLDVDNLFIYTNASIMVSNYYQFGTLSDFITYIDCNKFAIKSYYEMLILYYSLELLDIVGTIHSCGIIHANIKPDNLLMRDIRAFKSLSEARGHGLCLIDFSHSLDIQSFPQGCKFIGMNNSDGFRCAPISSDIPWTYQVDLCCVAGTTHMMMFNSDMKTIKDKRSDFHRISKPVPRMYDRVLWNHYFSSLLNWSSPDAVQTPNMIELTKPLIEKTNCKQFQENFCSFYSSYFNEEH